MIVAVSLLLSSSLVHAVTPASAHDKVSKESTAKMGQDFYSRTHVGTDADGFGIVLPKGLTPNKIMAAIAPRQDAAIATLVGAKAWSYHKNGYIAIACFATSKQAYLKEMQQGEIPNCAKLNGEGDKPVYLGLLEYKEGDKKPKVIARYDGPLDIKTNFGEGGMLPGEYFRFDFGPYTITETDTAFGLRFGWTSSASDGSRGYWEMLALFEVAGNRLINVYSGLMYHYTDTVGACKADGACDHTINESRSVLSVSNRKTQGHYNLVVRNLNFGGDVEFAWNSKKNRYSELSNPSSSGD